MGFPDFPIPDQNKSYLTQAEILEFLTQYVEHFELGPIIKVRKKIFSIHKYEFIRKNNSNKNCFRNFFTICQVAWYLGTETFKRIYIFRIYTMFI